MSRGSSSPTKMGGSSSKATRITREILEEYAQLTYLNKAEILQWVYIFIYKYIYICGIYLWIYGKFLEKFTLNLYIYIYKKYVYKNIYSVSRYKDCSLVHISLTFNWIQNQFGPFSFQYFQAFWDFSTRWGGSKLASPIASWENPKSATSTSCELQNSKYILMHFIDLFIFVDVNFLFHFFSFE